MKSVIFLAGYLTTLRQSQSDGRMNDELERISKEAVVFFPRHYQLSVNLPRET
jgi:hypothetical protein